MPLEQTRALVLAHIPNNDLAKIVLSYVLSVKRDWESISVAGEYETCLQIPDNDLNRGLNGACLGGHKELAELMISRGADNWNWGLYGACRGGHKELVELMISHGANDWNGGLNGACYGGHKELTELMISRGANFWNWGLFGACLGGHKELVELMISRGATACNMCNRSMGDHLHLPEQK